MKINDQTNGPKPTDAQIVGGWPQLVLLYRRGHVHRAVALGLCAQWADRGVTVADVDRLIP